MRKPMKKIYFLLLGSLFLLPVACNTEEAEAPEPTGETLFNGYASPDPDGGSRLTLSNPYSQGGARLYDALWDSGDAIKVYRVSDGAHLGNATLTEGASSRTGRFSLPAATGDDDVRIIYPTTAYYDGVHSLPQNQNQAGEGSRNFSAITFAYSEVTNRAAGNNFTLNHVPAFVKISVKAASTSDTWYGWSVTGVTLRVPGHVLSGQFSYDYAQARLTEGQTVYDNVTVTLGTPFTIGTTAKEVWLAALPDDLTGCLILVTLHLTKNSTTQNAVVKFTGRPLLSGSVNAMAITNLSSIIEPGSTSGSEYTTTTVQAHKNGTGNWTGYSSRLIAGMNRMDKYLLDTRDVWGGYKGVKPEHVLSTNSEGFWRTGTYHGRPMFIDPDGNVSFLNGVNCVTPDPLSDAADTRTTNYYNSKFSNVESWAAWCAGNIANYGFNFYSNNPRRFRYYRTDPERGGLGISEAAEERLHQGNNTARLSQVENLYLLRTFLWDYYSRTKKSFSTAVWSPFVLMWDPDWNDFCYKMALYAASLFKDDPCFIGYYTDNELPFIDKNDTYRYGISLKDWLDLDEYPEADYYYRCNPYAKAWAQAWMQETYGTTTYSSSMENAFLRAVSEYYYRTTAEAIRAADPNHLVMGSRLHANSKQKQEIVESCARYHDVVSINFYDYWDVTSFTQVSSIKGWAAGKPVIATEFYVKNANQKAPDGTAYSNQEGAGWWVQSQAARGQFYQNCIIRFIEEGTFAGWMWFKWTDDYRNTVPGWINKGLVVPDYSGTYTACTSLMKEVHWNLYQLLDYYWGAPTNSGRLAGDLAEGTWE